MASTVIACSIQSPKSASRSRAKAANIRRATSPLPGMLSHDITVNGASPTGSGLRLVPMMAGLLVTSIGAGRVISKIGRYKPFPIVGTALIVVGFILLAGMGAGQWLRSRVQPETFKTVFFCGLLLLGLYLALRGAMRFA